MIEPCNQKRWRLIRNGWVWLAPVLYVLSSGPTARVAFALPDALRKPVNHCLLCFYLPLLWAAVSWKLFGNILKWYLRLCGVF